MRRNNFSPAHNYVILAALSLVVSIALLIWSSFSVDAQQGTEGVDLVIALEISNRYGDGAGTLTSRLNAVEFTAETLIRDALHNHPGVQHRISLVTYSADSANTLINFDDEPNTEGIDGIGTFGPYTNAEGVVTDAGVAQAAKDFASFQQALSAISTVNDLYLYTQIYSDVARETDTLFTQLNSETAPRFQSVIIIAAGVPQVSVPDVEINATVMPQFSQFMSGRPLYVYMLPNTNPLFSGTAQDNAGIWTRLGMTTQVRSLLNIDGVNSTDPIGAAVSGASLVQDLYEDVLLPHLRLDQAIEVVSNLSLNDTGTFTYDVPLFASSVTFMVFSSAGVSISPAGGDTYTHTSASVTTYVMPDPGRYTITPSPGAVKAVIVRLRMGSAELTYVRDLISQWMEQEFSYTIRDVRGDVIDYPGEVVTADVTFELPTDESWTVSMSSNGETGALQGRFIPPKAGRYTPSIQLDYGLSNFAGAIASESSGFSADPLTLMTSQIDVQAFVGQPLTFTLTGLAADDTLAVVPHFSISSQQTDVLRQTVPLVQVNNEFQGTFEFARPTTSLTLTAQVSLTIPTSTGHTQVTLSNFAEFTGSVFVPSGSLNVPAVVPIYVNAPISVGFPDNALPQNVLANFGLQYCLSVEDRVVDSTVFYPLTNQLPLQQLIVPSNVGQYRLDLSIRALNECHDGGSVIESIDTAEFTSLQVYTAFMEADAPTLPVLDQFQSSTAQIGFFYADDGIPQRVTTFASGTAPPLQIVQPLAGTGYTLQQASSSYTLTFAAPLNDDPLTFEIGGGLPLYHSSTIITDGRSLQLTVRRAGFTVRFDAPNRQQFDTAAIEVELNGANGLDARALIERFPDAGIQAQAVFTVQNSDSTQAPQLDSVPLPLASGEAVWRSSLPLPLSGIYSLRVELFNGTGQVIAESTPQETGALSASIAPVIFTGESIDDQPIHAHTAIILDAPAGIQVADVLNTYGLLVCAVIKRDGQEVTGVRLISSSPDNSLTSSEFVPRHEGVYQVTFELRRTCDDNSADSRYAVLTASAVRFAAYPVYLALLDSADQVIGAPEMAQFLDASRQLGYVYAPNGTLTRYMGTLELSDRLTYKVGEDGIAQNVPDNSQLSFARHMTPQQIPVTVNALVPNETDGASTPLSFWGTTSNTINLTVTEAVPDTHWGAASTGAAQFSQTTISFNMMAQEGGDTFTMTDFAALGGSAEAVIQVVGTNEVPFSLQPIPLAADGASFVGILDLPLGGTYTAEIVLNDASNNEVWRFIAADPLVVTAQTLSLNAPTDAPVFGLEHLLLSLMGDAVDWNAILRSQQIVVCASSNQNPAVPLSYSLQAGAYTLALDTSAVGDQNLTVNLRKQTCEGEVIQSIGSRTFHVHDLFVAFADRSNQPYVPELAQFNEKALTIGYFYQVDGQALPYTGQLTSPPAVVVHGVAGQGALPQGSSSGYLLSIPAPLTTAPLNLDFDAHIDSYVLRPYPLGTAVSGSSITLNVSAANADLSIEAVNEAVQFGGATLTMPLVSLAMNTDAIVSAFDLRARAIISAPGLPEQQVIELDVQNGAFTTLQPIALPVGGTYNVTVEVYGAANQQQVLVSKNYEGGFEVQPLTLVSGDLSRDLEVDLDNTFDLHWQQGDSRVPISSMEFPPTVTWQIKNANGDAITVPRGALDHEEGYRIVWGASQDGMYQLVISWSAQTPNGIILTQDSEYTLAVGDVSIVKVILVGDAEQYFYTRYVLPIFDFVPLLQPGARRTQDLVFDIRLAADANRDGTLSSDETTAYSYLDIFGGQTLLDQSGLDATPEVNAAGSETVINPADVFTLSVTQGSTPIESGAYTVSYLPAPELNGYRLVVAGLPLGENYSFTLTANPNKVLRGYRLGTPLEASSTLLQSAWTYGYPAIFYGVIIAVISLIAFYCRITTNNAYRVEPHLCGFLRLEEVSGSLVGGDAGWQRDLSVHGLNTISYRREDNTWNFSDVWRIRVSTLSGSTDDVRVELFKRRTFLKAAQEFVHQLRGFSLCAWRDLFAGVPQVFELHADNPMGRADLGGEYLAYSMEQYNPTTATRQL